MRKIYRYIEKGIKNLIYWFPIIWQDRNFDHYYLSAILRHKLNDMVKFYDSEHAWGIDAPKLAHEMKVCVIILDRMLEDDYNKEGYDAHDEKWGELEFHDATGQLTITRKNRPFNEELEQEEFKKVYEKEERDRDIDIENLFQIMKKNLRQWWD